MVVKTKKISGGGNPYKTLILTALTGLVSVHINNACADETPIILGSAEADALLAQKNIEQPTLDYLKENNVVIPGAFIPETTVSVSVYRITDNDNNSKNIYTIYHQKYLSEDAYHALLENNKNVAYEVSSSDNYYTFSNLGASNWDEALEKFREKASWAANATYTDPKEAYDEYYANLPATSFTPDITEYSSAYTITPGTKDDYSFIYKIVDEEGRLTDNYYKINLKTLGASDNITWTELEEKPEEGTQNTITIKLPNNVEKYYSYAYTMPEGYTEINAKIPNLTQESLTNKTFKGITSTMGTIYNDEDLSNINIIADFIDNAAYMRGDYASGGAIYNQAYNRTAIIGDITGDFINNSATSPNWSVRGGAIANYAVRAIAEIGNITGDFINNYVTTPDSYSSSSGGAIYNNTFNSDDIATIGNITGNFINNVVTATGYYTSAVGGAIYNSKGGTIGNITGNFINNSTTSTDHVASGGAIYNAGNKIGNITGDFINNSVNSIKSYAQGGAILAGGRKIGDIIGDFINNSATGFSYANGGAIYAGSYEGGNITGDFISNSANSTDSYAQGGAIYNQNHTIGDITGDFINNSVTSNISDASGGAIYNNTSFSNADAIIGDITGDFINNAAITTSGKAQGGAIYNNIGTIGEVNNAVTFKNLNFLNNFAKSETGTAQGGAIWTNTDMNIIADNGTSEFTGNYLQIGDVKDSQAVYLALTEITSVSASSLGLDYPGEVYTANTLPSLTLKAENNGKVIFNDKITASAIKSYRWNYSRDSQFIPNVGNDYVSTYHFLDENNNETSSYKYYQTSVYQTIPDVGNEYIDIYYILDADNNTTASYKFYSDSGDQTMPDGSIQYVYTAHILGEDNNEIESIRYYKDDSNSIYTYHILDKDNNEIKTIISPDDSFITAYNNPMQGFENIAKISLTGDSTGNIALNNEVQNANASLNNTTLKLGITDAENHTSDVFATSALTANSGVIDTKDGIYTNYNIKKLDSSDVVRYGIDMVLSKDEQKADTFTLSEGGSGTIYLSSINVTNNAGADEEYTIQIIKTQEGQNAPQLAYDESKVLTNGVQAHMDNQMILGDDFGLATTATANDSIRIRGLKDVLAEWLEYIPAAGEEKVFDFLDNSGYVLSRDVTALNGDTLTINGSGNTLDINHKNAFSEIGETQKVKISDLTLSNVDTLTNNGAAEFDKVNLETPKLTNNGTLTAKEGTLDTLSLANTGTFNVTGGEVILGAATNDGNITLDTAKLTLNGDLTSTGRGTLNLTKIEPVEISHLIANQDIFSTNAVLNLANVSNFANNSLAMTGGALNLARLGINDNLRFNSITMQGGEINITSVDVDMAAEKMGQISAGSHGDISGTVNVNNLNILSASDKELIRIKFADDTFAQSVEYHGKDKIETPIYNYAIGYEKDSGEFHFVRGAGGSGNKAEAFNPSVLTAPVAAQAGAYSAINNSLDYAFEHLNAFSLLPSNQRRAALQRQSISTAGKSSGDTAYADGKTGWIKPYAMYESVDLKNGPEPDVTSYGTLIGLDGSLQEMTNGWERVTTLYAGYNGSKISYDDIDTYQNGGILGITETLYKGNFSTAFTATAGASEGRADTTYGHENFTSLLAGIANKTGYNFEFEEGKYIIQPIMLTSYSFANTLDYTNAAGVKVDSDPLHVVQLHPQVKFIINPDSGWQSYAKAGMVWNLMDKTKFTADDARLPEMSIKPYAEYGIGMQKHWAEKYSAWGEFLGRSGGRDGIAVSAGFRWDFGK